MSRPVTISSETILEAARALFGLKGLRATTAEIAARAGVSEGTLFKRFGSKVALYREAIPLEMVTDRIREKTLAQPPLRTQADFARFIRWLIGSLRDVVPHVTMKWAARHQLGDPPTGRVNRRAPALVALRGIADLLEEGMDAGHLARRDTEAMARIIHGSVWHFVFLELLLNRRPRSADDRRFAGELARVLFADLGAQKARRSRRAAH